MEQSNPQHLIIGRAGEEIAAKYLMGKGFIILDRNYRKKWGEIDIVSRETTGRVHFIEVKTVSYETLDQLNDAVTRRTWRPEENVHTTKLKKLSRAIHTWISEHNLESEWQIDVITVRVVPREKYASIKVLPSIVIDD
jgi:putative endonuclease